MLTNTGILTGGEVISEKVGLKLENADLSLLGRSARSSSARTRPPSWKARTTLTKAAGRINQIRREIEKTDPDYDREKPAGSGWPSRPVALP